MSRPPKTRLQKKKQATLHAFVGKESQGSEMGDNGKNKVDQKATSTETPQGQGHSEQNGARSEVHVEPSSTEIMAAINSFRKEFNGRMDEVKGDLEGVKKNLGELNKTCADTVLRVQELERSLQFSQNTIEDNKAKLTEHDAQFKTLERQILRLDGVKRDLETQILNLERHSRDYNVRINGVKQTLGPGEDCRSLVADTIVSCGWSGCSKEEVCGMIENAHRTGKLNEHGERQIIARFYCRPDRNAILGEARKKWNAEGPKIFADMIKADFDAKKKASGFMKEAYERGHKVIFRRGEMWVDGKKRPIPDEAAVAEALSKLPKPAAQGKEKDAAPELQ